MSACVCVCVCDYLTVMNFSTNPGFCCSQPFCIPVMSKASDAVVCVCVSALRRVNRDDNVILMHVLCSWGCDLHDQQRISKQISCSVVNRRCFTVNLQL